MDGSKFNFATKLRACASCAESSTPPATRNSWMRCRCSNNFVAIVARCSRFLHVHASRKCCGGIA
eukprot:2169603-Alexandrium_andersonii.AAC.1